MKKLECGLINLGKIFKICVALTIILVLIGVGIGATRIYQAKQERQDIGAINTSLEKGLTPESKNLISAFMGKYPESRNVVITDKDNNITYSANYEGIEGKTKFILEQDKLRAEVFGLKDGKNKFRHMDPIGEGMGPGFGRIDPMMQGRNGVGQKMMGRMGRFEVNMPFISSARINDNMNVYYISKAFRANYLSNIMMVTGMLLRILGLVFWILLAVWVYKDSKERKLNPIFWGIITLITGLLGLIVYMIFRHFYNFCNVCKNKISKDTNFCERCGANVREKCSDCQTVIKSGINYCPNCGKQQDIKQK